MVAPRLRAGRRRPAATCLRCCGDSVRLRLRADVPVGAYLSGRAGLELDQPLSPRRRSGTRAADLLDRLQGPPLRRARPPGSRWRGCSAPTTTWSRPGRRRSPTSFPAVVRHAETPLVRTAPVPLFLLAREVRDHEITVVITGEGADELFWGYDLFKEVALRELHRTRPRARPGGCSRSLYPYLGPAGAPSRPGLAALPARDGVVRGSLSLAPDPRRGDRHGEGPLPARGRRRARATAPRSRASRAELPAAFDRWSSLERAGWLELATLLEPYLLAAQGDRVAMAHGVEGRFPVPRPPRLRPMRRRCRPSAS